MKKIQSKRGRRTDLKDRETRFGPEVHRPGTYLFTSGQRPCPPMSAPQVAASAAITIVMLRSTRSILEKAHDKWLEDRDSYDPVLDEVLTIRSKALAESARVFLAAARKSIELHLPTPEVQSAHKNLKKLEKLLSDYFPAEPEGEFGSPDLVELAEEAEQSYLRGLTEAWAPRDK